MAQLIQMRRKISAIGTIKKITQAMRLISMSSHTQMSNKFIYLQNYKNELLRLLNIIEFNGKNLKSSFANHENATKRKLIILVGTQKGLAGTFNTSLFRLFEKNMKPEDFIANNFITVGKRAADYLKKYTNPMMAFDNFNQTKLNEIASTIFEIILKAKPAFNEVIIYSNYPKSFFAQIPTENVLIPISKNLMIDEKNISQTQFEQYVWEESIDELYDSLIKEYVLFSIKNILFNSLMAEHAARFQSMDSATKNAQEILDTLKLQYNKLRQAKITTEITEISSIAPR